MTDNDYSILIGKFVNDTKREVEDAHDWLALRTNVSLNTVASTTNYTITGTNQRTKILDVLNTTQNSRLYPVSHGFINTSLHLGTSTNGSPYYYRVRGIGSSDELVVDIWPTPDAVYATIWDCVVPQADLSADSDTLTVPYLPVVLGAWARAVSERGEDESTNTSDANGLYISALGDAIQLDASRVRDEYIWQPV